MRTSEHILLESSESREVPELRNARRIHARALLRSRLRRQAVELVLLDYCYLSLRSQRWRGPISHCVLDLRFVDPTPRVARHIAYHWIAASALVFSLAALLAWQVARSPGHWWQHSSLPLCLGLFTAAIGVACVAFWRTTETFALYSTHGRARLLEFTGEIGTFRALRAFEPLLIAHLRHAVAARRRDFGDHLRDEMREHSRLRDLGVLSQNDYEISKRRVLAAHGWPQLSTRRSGARTRPLTHRSPDYRAVSAV
jgi:hypothetical protein